MEGQIMFMQEGDKSILANVGKTVLILIAVMIIAMIAANIFA